MGSLIEVLIAGHEYPAFSGYQQFRALETKRREVAKRPHSAPVEFRSNRRSRVLDDIQFVLARNLDELIHLCGVAVKMNRDYRARLFRDLGFHGSWIQAPTDGLYIREYRSRAGIADRVRRRNPGQVRHNHFVARSKPKGQQSDVKRARATGGSHGEIHSNVLAKRPLEARQITVPVVIPTGANRVQAIPTFGG